MPAAKSKPSQGPVKSGGRQKGTPNKKTTALNQNLKQRLDDYGDDGHDPVHVNIIISEECLKIARDKRTGLKDKHKYYSIASKIETDFINRIHRVDPLDLNSPTKSLEDMLDELSR